MAKILVVDDERAIRKLLRQTLERAGYEVMEAGNGREALRTFQELGPADVVITDILMPEQDGLEIVVELRKQHPGIKVITISGGGGSGTLNLLPAAKRLGASHTFQKPLDRRALVEKVRELLAESDDG